MEMGRQLTISMTRIMRTFMADQPHMRPTVMRWRMLLKKGVLMRCQQKRRGKRSHMHVCIVGDPIWFATRDDHVNDGEFI